MDHSQFSSLSFYTTKPIMEFNSIHNFYSKLSLLSSQPLFSTFVTLYTLILLYAPSYFLTILLSPVLNSTAIVLLFLLKLGANERSEKDANCLEPTFPSLEQRFLDLVDRNQTDNESHHMQVEYKHELALDSSSSNSQDGYYRWEYLLDAYSMETSSQVVDNGEPRMNTTLKFHKWNMKVPLEIIYEAYEGEEEEEEDDDDETNMVSRDEQHVSGLERYPSLSMYYPESETDSSSDDEYSMNKIWETHERLFLDWEKEADDDREELIEISVDCYDKKSIEFCRVEEDNLIEIDIFPARF